MSDANKCALCGGRISKERQISAATRGCDVRAAESIGKVKYCSTAHRIEANWRRQAERRTAERAAARDEGAGKAKLQARPAAKKTTKGKAKKRAGTAKRKRNVTRP